jgi:hypothetical protein
MSKSLSLTYHIDSSIKRSVYDSIYVDVMIAGIFLSISKNIIGETGNSVGYRIRIGGSSKEELYLFLIRWGCLLGI